MTAKWTFQHESATDITGLHDTSPTDARGLKLRLECGYTWMNKNDGNGWIQTSVEFRRTSVRESVG